MNSASRIAESLNDCFISFHQSFRVYTVFSEEELKTFDFFLQNFALALKQSSNGSGLDSISDGFRSSMSDALFSCTQFFTCKSYPHNQLLPVTGKPLSCDRHSTAELAFLLCHIVMSATHPIYLSLSKDKFCSNELFFALAKSTYFS